MAATAAAAASAALASPGRAAAASGAAVAAGRLDGALPSQALPSQALPSQALPSQALPSQALPSEALPSRPPGHKCREAEGAGASPAVGRPLQRPRVTVKSGAVTVPKPAAQIDALCTVCGVRDDSSELLSCWTCRKSLSACCEVKCQAAASCKHVSCPGCIRNPRCGRTATSCVARTARASSVQTAIAARVSAATRATTELLPVDVAMSVET
jgi:hypothetical protein